MVVRIVEVIVFRFRENRPEVLLLRRSGDEEVYPGVWQVVTGRIQEGESAFAAARREIREETGLTPWRIWSVPYVGRFFDARRDEMHLAPFFAAQVPPGEDPVLSREHDEGTWISVDEAIRKVPIVGQQEAIDVVSRTILRDPTGGDLWLVR
jgi:dATP pyrophosphohydrolase